MDMVHSGYFKAFVDRNLLFTKTLVIHLTILAELLNTYVETKFGFEVDKSDKTTWKYYMNVAGEYHPTDTMMRVISIDTLDEIEFTKENLVIHTATAEAYRYGSRYYNSLLVEYPDQELLINGILIPADIETAIDASDGAILAYDKSLIETNEYTLIEDLQFWIYSVVSRWYVKSFVISNPLYPAAFLQQLYLQISPKLMNLRLARIKTIEVNSFHVRMYLASHNELDAYLPYLTLEQQLWLYRNIAYLERHPGHTDTFKTLIDRILTPRGIPLGDYTIRQTNQPGDNKFPEIRARIKPINSVGNLSYVDYHSVENLFLAENPLQPGNAAANEANLPQELTNLTYADSAVIGTKALLSSMIDYSNAVPTPFYEIATREWCSLSWSGFLDVVVPFKDPKDSMSYSLLSKDAFLYFYYVTLMSYGYEVDVAPEFLNIDYRCHPLPSKEELLSVVFNPDSTSMSDFAEAILAGQPIIRTMYSTSSFNEYIHMLYDQSYVHWMNGSFGRNMEDRASYRVMVEKLYQRKKVIFDTGYPNMKAWLFAKNLPEFDHSFEQAQELAKSIYESATGYRIDDTRLLRNIQRNLIGLVEDLSSYSVQYIRQINESDVTVIDNPPITYGNQREFTESTEPIRGRISIVDHPSELQSTYPLNTDRSVTVQSASTKGMLTIAVDPTVGSRPGAISGINHQALIAPTKAGLTYTGQDLDADEQLGCYGLSELNAMSQDFLKSIKLR